MRELSTDRPDKTESAYTVDAGHFQIEMDLFSYTHDQESSGGVSTRVNSWAVAPVNLKVGLCNRADLQCVIETYNHVEETVAGIKTTQRGFGDITTRLKLNLWGNDGGDTAFAMMPYVKFPSNQDQLGNNAIEGGLICPLAVELPGGFGMGLMTQFDFVEDGDAHGYQPEFVNSVTISHDLVGKLAGYVEFWSSVSTESGSKWIGTIDLGLTYGLTDNLQLDAGINIGVTSSADDWNPFVGFSCRF